MTRVSHASRESHASTLATAHDDNNDIVDNITYNDVTVETSLSTNRSRNRNQTSSPLATDNQSPPPPTTTIVVTRFARVRDTIALFVALVYDWVAFPFANGFLYGTAGYMRRLARERRIELSPRALLFGARRTNNIPRN